jgi:mono/diheme cytochrome c family protein
MNAALLSWCAFWAAQQEPGPLYARVHEVFVKRCVSCHSAAEHKGELVLESHDAAMKGGGDGAVVVAGEPDKSELLRRVRLPADDDDRMPSKGDPLTAAEIEVIRAWIAAGAPAPRPGEALAPRPALPKIEPKVTPRRPITSLAVDPKGKLVALGRFGEVELRSAEDRGVVRRLAGHAGSVNDLAFSADGSILAAAGGEPAVGGEVMLWNPADGARVRVLKGHADAIHAVAISPDGKRLATGGYDRKVILWDLTAGTPVRELSGHNEAVLDVAFRPDGAILASASADRTVKLWDVATGERRDTLSESTKALHAVVFAPDGRSVAAGGADNRIRVWDVGPEAREGSNPIRASQFAHEGTILALRYSPDGAALASSADDRSVKVWNAADFSARAVLEAQPDWPVALGFASGGKALLVGRLDGTLGFYDAVKGTAMAPPKPEPAPATRMALQSGTTAKFRVTGKHLAWLDGVKLNHPKLEGLVLPDDAGDAGAAWISVSAGREVPPGAYTVSLINGGGASAPLKLYVDNIPQLVEVEPNDAPSGAMPIGLPGGVWGMLEKPNDVDRYVFEAAAGQTVVFDVAAHRLGSKADVLLTLAEASGRVLAGSTGAHGDADPLLTHTFAEGGRFEVRVEELTMGASPEHFYRLSAGVLPVVTACFPLSAPPNAEVEVRLIGLNVPADATVKVKTVGPGEAVVPIDPERFRARREIKLLVAEGPQRLESEPNDAPGQATPIAAPGAVDGRIGAPGDVDVYAFEAKAGQTWIIETAAAQRGSPADTRIEVLHADGRPVERLLLRAVRDSFNTFRPIDADAGGARLENWEEMELNQYVYLEGEVCKLFLAPRGPDSQWDFYGVGGRRLCYFDTSPTAHALDSPAYIVEPHPPGAKFAPNGLPVFTLNYANDDDAERRIGRDSRLRFTAPADGSYRVRVTDTRGWGGEEFGYRLAIREARPDFSARLDGLNPSIPPGTGRSFTVSVDRIDGFDGPVRVEIAGVPAGFTVSTPIVVEEGHRAAKGTIFAAEEAPAGEGAKATASARIGDREVVKEIGGLGKLSVEKKAPPLRVRLEPDGGPGGAMPPEILIAPGQEVAAVLKIERRDFKERVTFELENLPHGVIVSDIGLNGVLIAEDQTERRIFIKCASWVAPTERLCHARANEAGGPTSGPVLLKVRRP